MKFIFYLNCYLTRANYKLTPGPALVSSLTAALGLTQGKLTRVTVNCFAHLEPNMEGVSLNTESCPETNMGAAAQTTHQTRSRDTKLFAPDQSKAINKLRRVDSMFLLFRCNT